MPMPYYQLKCNECGDQREYSVPRPGNLPARCESCDSNSGLFERVYDGQTFGISEEQRNREHYKITFHSTMKLSCGCEVGKVSIEKQD